MLIPLRDDNLIRNRPVGTIGIVAVCAVVFLFQLTLTGRGARLFALGYGMIPAVLFGTERLSAAIPHVAPWATILTSMFLHGGWGRGGVVCACRRLCDGHGAHVAVPPATPAAGA